MNRSVMFSLRGICLTLFVFAYSAGISHADATLRWKFTAGAKSKYQSEMVQKTEFNGQRFDSKTVMDFTVEVKSVDSAAGTADVSVKYTRMQMKMDNPAMPIDVDTNKKEDKDSDDPMKKLFTTMLQSEVILTVNELGEIKKTKVPDDVKKAIEGAGPMAQQMSFLTEEGMKGAAGLFTFPKEAVANGKTWTQESKMDTPQIAVKTTTEYTYKGTTSEKGSTFEKIGVKPTISFESKGGFDMKVSKQSSEGTILFDANAGRIHDSNSTQKLSLSIDAGGQQMEMSSETKTSLKLVEDKK